MAAIARPRIVIVGGIAGGASCAARLRRLVEDVDIVMVDRSPFLAVATCGLPYRIGNIIKSDAPLAMATTHQFKVIRCLLCRRRCRS
jgi:NADPH-dependent 2,4-dienoyl-CoA reductase/sulfur reductase-like enzyme